MEAELKSLEEKISQFLSVAGTLRDENRQLRTQLTKVEVENRLLAEKVATAANHLEGLLPLLPNPTPETAE